MQRFEPVDPWGVRSFALKKIEQAAYPETEHWSPADRNLFWEEMWRSGRLEEGSRLPLAETREVRLWKR